MGYNIRFAQQIEKDLKGIDTKVAREIITKIDRNLSADPYHFGKPLRGRFKGLYRYRIGDYRVIYSINNNEIYVLILRIGHRKNIYD